jgi:tetratricopeptide (TPR) repeat protein
MEKIKKNKYIVTVFFLIICNQVFAFDTPKLVCLDPGHGGTWQGTMGWNDRGPAEKVHNLSACQLLDKFLFWSYEDEWGFETYNYLAIHTRIDDSQLSYDQNEDLHHRSEIANGNENGWYNQNFDSRWMFPPVYGEPWWTEITIRPADFFLSYHYDGVDDYSIQRTDCHFHFDYWTWEPGELTFEDDRQNAAIHMIEQISAKVKNIYVSDPMEGAPFYFSTIPGTAFNSNFRVLKDLDYSEIEKGGVLTEALFYSNYDAWRTLNCNDETDWVEYNICDGIEKALYKLFKGEPTGLEDGIVITNCPDYVDQNTTISVTAQFIDEDPPNILGTVTCKLYGASLEGSIELSETYSIPDGYGWLNFDVDVPSLSNWDNTWLRDSEQNNYICGQIALFGTENDGTLLIAYYDVLIYSPPTTSGTLNNNEMWCGIIQLTGSVTVPLDRSLVINNATIIKFAPGIELIINGTLTAEGTSSHPITFTSASSSPQKGDWDWIKFDNSSGSSILEYCDIEYAKTGIWCMNGFQVSLEYVEVTNCQDFGLYLLNNSAYTSVENSSFKHTTNCGMFLYNSDPVIINANCMYNRYGLYCYNNSNPEVGHSNFSENEYDGITGINTGYIWMYYNYPHFQNRGYNTILSNNGEGVSAFSYSFPYMGINSSYPGNNTIKYNGAYEIYNGNSSGYIFARYNWWESSTPDLFTSQTVLIDPINTSAAQITSLSKQVIDNEVISPTANSIPEEYNQLATTFLMEGNYEKARGLFQYVIENYPDSEEAKYALVNMTACFDQLIERSNVVPYLEGISEGYSRKEISDFALSLSVPYLESTGKYTQAVERCRLVSESSKDEEVKKNMLFIMANIHFYGLKETGKAKQYFEEYIKKYPKDELAQISQDMLEIMDHRFIPKEDNPEKTETKSTPTEFVLSQNYPNPFNPETEICFQLPEDVHVAISIYNMLGQRVCTLIDKQKQTGYHTIKWDGRNDFGTAVASGVYLYAMQAGKFYEKKKMVLMR